MPSEGVETRDRQLMKRVMSLSRPKLQFRSKSRLRSIEKAAGDEEEYLYYMRTVPGAFFHDDTLMQGYMCYKWTLNSIAHMKMRRSDVLLCSYPKAGTTWTEEIVSLIKYKGNVERVQSKLYTRVVNLEVGRPWNPIYFRRMKSPRTLQSHLPYDSLPDGAKSGKCKIIYVMRNPKDNAVSYYHHHRIARFLGNYDRPFTEFSQLFLRGQLVYGSWFDHVLSFWQRRKEGHILFIKYEDMKQDLRREVIRISKFLDSDLTDGAIDTIVNHCSFDSMKRNKYVNRESIPLLNVFDMSKGKFMRKGIVGDWRNHFTDEDSKEIDVLCETKLAPLGLQFEFGLPEAMERASQCSTDSGTSSGDASLSDSQRSIDSDTCSWYASSSDSERGD